MAQHVIGDVGAKFLVVGIGQFVVNDLGKHAMPASQTQQFIELLQAENGWFLNEDVLPGLEGLFGGLKMAGVRGGNTDHVNPVRKQPRDGILAGEVGEVGNAAGGLSFVILPARAGSAGGPGQRDFDETEIPTVKSFCMKLLEERPICLLENHAQADHAGSQAMLIQIRLHPHANHLNSGGRLSHMENRT